MKSHVLVIEDDADLVKLISVSLRAHGFAITSAHNGRDGLKAIYATRPDVVLLDLMMPEMDGWQVCERVREFSDVPILVISARDSDTDVIRALRMGADDYVRKPLSLGELNERVYAVLRRVKAAETREHLSYDDGVLRVDAEGGQVWRRDELLSLTPTEFRLLLSLVAQKGSVVRHEDLLDQVWGPGYRNNGNACLSLYIRYLREKIEDDPAEPRYIQTRWGIGYWFAEPTTLPPTS